MLARTKYATATVMRATATNVRARLVSNIGVMLEVLHIHKLQNHQHPNDLERRRDA